MRILWVKVGGLWPINMGGRIRSFHMISALSRSNRMTVLTTHGTGDDPDGLRKQLPNCERVVSVPYAVPKRGTPGFAVSLLQSWFSEYPIDVWRWRVSALREEVRRVLDSGQVDLCVADFIFAMPNLPSGCPVPIVFFEHNVEHMIWKRLAEVEGVGWKRPLLELEWRKMRRYETRSCHRAKLTVSVSDVDRALLATHAPHASVTAVGTGVDVEYFCPNGSMEMPATLVFTGSMDWYPNEDAILYFIDAILPKIRRRIRDISFTVVGRNPTSVVRETAERAGVQVTGLVDDVRPFMSRAVVYVVPLRIGGGTRLKIFEALAMGKALVSTTVGAEGLPLVPGVHFLQEDDPNAFADAVVSLVQDPGRRALLGQAGRRLVEDKFSWMSIAREFEARCKEVVNHAG